MQGFTAHYQRGKKLESEGLQVHAQGIKASTIEVLYEVWGDQCAAHCSGGFSFIVIDHTKQCLYGARSPIGMNNLVYSYDGSRFSCASTLAQLLEDPTIKRDLDTQWIAYWLVNASSHWGMTPYAAIKELLPGHYFKIDENGLSIKPFWQPYPRKTIHYKDHRDYTHHFLMLLEQIIKEIPENALYDLSGGLDSSSIVCIATSSKPVQAFHAHAYSDDYVQAVCEQYQITLHTIDYHQHIHFSGDSLPLFVQPYNQMKLPGFYRQLWQIVAQVGATNHVRGDFGDQLLDNRAIYLRQLWQEKQISVLASEIWQWNMSSFRMIEKYILPIAHRKPIEAAWLHPDMLQAAQLQREQDEQYLRERCMHPFYRQFYRHMLEHTDYVVQAEAAEQIAGIRTIEPFADIRLIEFMLSVPPQYQSRPGTTKPLLRDAMKDILPDIIRQRTEKGQEFKLVYKGIAQHHNQLIALAEDMPESMKPYFADSPRLAQAIRQVAAGGEGNAILILGALLLLQWAQTLRS